MMTAAFFESITSWITHYCSWLSSSITPTSTKPVPEKADQVHVKVRHSILLIPAAFLQVSNCFQQQRLTTSRRVKKLSNHKYTILASSITSKISHQKRRWKHGINPSSNRAAKVKNNPASNQIGTNKDSLNL